MAYPNIYYSWLILLKVNVYEWIGVFAYALGLWLHNSLVPKE